MGQGTYHLPAPFARPIIAERRCLLAQGRCASSEHRRLISPNKISLWLVEKGLRPESEFSIRRQVAFKPARAWHWLLPGFVEVWDEGLLAYPPCRVR